VQFDHVALLVPDIAAALEWWQRMVPEARIVYADGSWGLLEAGGARMAFVTEGEHPQHVAFKVSPDELERMATEHGVDIAVHRDGSRSFYVEAPGHGHLEVIAYPDVLEEDFE